MDMKSFPANELTEEARALADRYEDAALLNKEALVTSVERKLLDLATNMVNNGSTNRQANNLEEVGECSTNFHSTSASEQQQSASFSIEKRTNFCSGSFDGWEYPWILGVCLPSHVKFQILLPVAISWFTSIRIEGTMGCMHTVLPCDSRVRI